MQQKIPDSPPPPITSSSKHPQTNQVLFSQIMEYLENISHQTQLVNILQVAKNLQQSEVKKTLSLSKGTIYKTSEAGNQKIWQQYLIQLQNGKNSLSLLQQLKGNVESGNPNGMLSALEQLGKTLTTPENYDLSIEMQRDLKNALSSLLNQTTNGESISDLLVKIAILDDGQTTLQKGGSETDVQNAIFQKLNVIVHSMPPNLLTSSAQQLLQKLKSQNGEGILNQFLKDHGAKKQGAQKNLLALLDKAVKNPNVLEELSEGVDHFEQHTSPGSLYEGYAIEVENTLTTTYMKQYLQPNVDQEIGSLKNIVQLLLQQFPKNSQLKQLSEHLDNLSRQSPDFDPDSLGKLNSQLQQLFHSQGLINQQHLPPPTLAELLGHLKKMLGSFSENHAAALTQLKEDSSKLNEVVAVLNLMTSHFSTLQNKMEKLKNGDKLSAAENEQLFKAVSSLMNQYTSLNSEQQSHLDDLFDKLGELKTGEKTTGPDFFADAQIAAWCQEFQKNTDDHRPEALMEWIQGKANEISNEKMNNSFYSQFSASLQSILNTQGFPEAGGNTKMTFGKLSQGEFSANPHYWEESSKTISLSRSEAEKALQSLNETFGQFKKDLSAASGGLAATKTATEGLGAAQDKTLNAIGYSEAQAKAAESLPDKFIEALFKIYMPGQEAYLMALSMMLAFSNAGSGMCNSVLNMITGWANSANSYGFSNWYNSMTGKVTQSQVQNAMNSEINQINGDVAAAKNAVTAAQNEIKKINQQVTDGQITPSQGKALTDKLNNNILQFTGPDGAISHLNTLLDQLKNHTTVNKDGTLSPADAVKTIQNEEKMVINGDPASDPPGSGGLSNIYTSISNDLLSYESQSQQQQITLQMKMTQIQQEWTVVSTALQLLNQMYMTVAQSINK